MGFSCTAEYVWKTLCFLLHSKHSQCSDLNPCAQWRCSLAVPIWDSSVLLVNHKKSSQEAKNSQRREEMGVRENKVEKAEGKKKKEDRT